LDIAMKQKDVPKLREFLETRGYKEIKLEEAKPWNFVLGDDKDHEIDVHAIVFDDKGNGLYGPVERGVMYPAASLTGSGVIDGHTVKCISPEWMVEFHSGYKLKDKDFKDVSAIPGKGKTPVTTLTSPLAFRQHPCNTTPLTGTLGCFADGVCHGECCPQRTQASLRRCALALGA